MTAIAADLGEDEDDDDDEEGEINAVEVSEVSHLRLDRYAGCADHQAVAQVERDQAAIQQSPLDPELAKIAGGQASVPTPKKEKKDKKDKKEKKEKRKSEVVADDKMDVDVDEEEKKRLKKEAKKAKKAAEEGAAEEPKKEKKKKRKSEA